jgi:hypothetical protein
MIHAHRNVFSTTESALSISNIPLLDDAFDPDEEEIFDHSELPPLHASYHEEEEFAL